jgi:hypothetical protein
MNLEGFSIKYKKGIEFGLWNDSGHWRGSYQVQIRYSWF